MRLRQARKIMNNVRLRRGMLWIYGTSRVDKANRICLHHNSQVYPGIKTWNILIEANPVLALKLLGVFLKEKKQKQAYNK